MPFSSEQKDYIYNQMGVSPNDYDIDESSGTLVSKAPKLQPASSPTPYISKLDSGIPGVTRPRIATSSPIKAFAQSAAEAAPSTLAGGLGAAGTLAMLGGAGLDVTGVGALAGIPLMALGAYATSKATKMVQNKVEPQEWQDAAAKSAQEHPVAATLGSLSTIPLSGFGPNSIGNIGKAAGAIPKLLSGMSTTPEEIGQLANIGIGAALPPIQNIVEAKAAGQPMPSGKSLLFNALVGAVMSKPNAIGKSMGFHDLETGNNEFTPEMLAQSERAKPASVQSVSETPIGDVAAKPDIESLSPNELEQVTTGEKQSLHDLLLSKAKEEIDNGPALSITPKAKPVEKPATTTREASTDETRKMLMSLPEEKNQETSNILTEPEQQVSDLLESKGYSGSLTSHWFNLAQEIAGKRGAKLAFDKDLQTAGQTQIPQFRNTVDAILAKINPAKAGADTPTHELLHIFVNDLRNSERPRDREFVNKYDSLVSEHPDYQQWAEKRKTAGLDSSPEEYQATNQGVESINRALTDETPFEQWKNDFSSYLKTRWGKHADVGDYQRLMNYKLLHDPAYHKILSINPNVSSSDVETKSQDESNIPKWQQTHAKKLKYLELYREMDKPIQDKLEALSEIGFKDDPNTILGAILSAKNPGIEENNPQEFRGKVGNMEFTSPSDFYRRVYRSYKSKFPNHVSDIENLIANEPPEKKALAQKIGELEARAIKEQSDTTKYQNESNIPKMELTPVDRQILNIAKEGQDERNKTLSELQTKIAGKTTISYTKGELANFLKDQEGRDYLSEKTDTLDIANHWDRLQKADDKISRSLNMSKQVVGNPVRNQERSNLVNPTHDSIKEAINEAVQTSDDATITPDRADAIQNALDTEVKWPEDSKVKEYLKGKSFDNLDPDHWQQLRQLYNNEYDTYSTKKATQVGKVADKPGTKEIEVPRTIPEVATETGKSAEENKPVKRQNPSKSKFTTDILDKTNEPIQRVAAPSPVKPISNKILTRDRVRMPEEKEQNKLFSKMQWDEVDNTKNPQATMDYLKQQYDAATERQHSSFGAGDRDIADDMASLRTATLMRMHSLNEKHPEVKIPEVSRSQTASNLPDLHNRVEEFDEPQQQTDLDYLTPKGFTTQLDKIRKTAGYEGNALADEYEKYAPLKERMFGESNAPIHNALKGLSKEDLNHIENVGIMESREKRDHSNLLTPKQQVAHEAIRDELAKYSEDPHFWPHQISPRVAEQIAENGHSSNDLKNDFIEYQLSHGRTKEEANKALEKIEAAYDAGTPNLTRFQGIRDLNSIGLPDSWMRNGLKSNLSRFLNRAVADKAFSQTFEKNPDVLASAFGRKNDSAGQPINTNFENIGANKDVKALTERITGEPFDKDESWIKSFNRVATSLMLGPLTNVHIAASSVANSLQYLKPTESIPALAKAIVNITDGYQKALTAGKIKPNNSVLKDIVDINNTGIEKWRAASDMISKINGRDATNNFTHAYLQNVGEWIINSKRIAADAGDTHAIDLMKRVDPDYTSGKNYSPQELQSMASTFAGIIHGSHDARTLPGWMLKDTAIQPFFSLASWNIAQTNAWFRHVLTPAKNGNFVPLIMSTLGSALGGYVIKRSREAIADKKSPIPSLGEVVNSSRGAEGNIPLIAYNLAAMSSYVGFAGILSVGAKAGFDLAYKNIPQAATFPLDEVLGNSVHRVGQAAAALMNDPNADYLQVGSRLAIDLAKENVQMARLVTSWAANSDVSKEIPGMAQEKYGKELNQKTQDLRRFKMVEGAPYEEQSVSESNPYLSSALKTFKRSQDIGESVHELPNLIQAAFRKANGNVDVLRSELHKLKANTYPTMPDPERMPSTFIHYLNFLRSNEGDQAASDRMMDYFRHKAINKAKSSMVPSV